MKKVIKRTVIIIFTLMLACTFAACSQTDKVHSKSTDISSNAGKEKTTKATEKTTKAKEKQTKATEETTKTPAASYAGALKVTGTKLTDKSGNTVQLRGLSTHGIAWFPDYINQDFIRQLHDDFGINVIRFAMYTEEYNGYCSGGNQTDLKEMINRGVQYATENDMYAIIDWHTLSDNNPKSHLDEAVNFFDEMSKKYSDADNVIYEICNEPNGGTTWEDIKDYAQQVIKVIRANDKDGVILVGTPNWCQYTDEVADNPIEGYDNIMYTLHFYAATHKDDIRQRMQSSIDKGVPVFVSEFGICDASGSGAIDENEAGKWLDIMNKNDVSYVMWNISNKDETSSIFKASCDKNNGFTQDDLSDSGKWFLNMMNGKIDVEDVPKASQETKSQDNSGSDKSADKNNSNDDTKINDNVLLKAKSELVNSWEADGKKYCQYNIEVINDTDSNVSGWKSEIELEDDVSISQSWNGNFKVDGKKIIITPADYNSMIEKGKSVKDIGIIVEIKSKVKSKTGVKRV